MADNIHDFAVSDDTIPSGIDAVNLGNTVEPRHDYLKTATCLLATNLRLIDQAHDALHWLNFENRNLEDFDRRPEIVLNQL